MYGSKRMCLEKALLLVFRTFSPHFGCIFQILFSIIAETLLQSALVVDIIGGQNKSFLITFRHYKEGDAPVRIDNFCEDLFLKISQGNLGQVKVYYFLPDRILEHFTDYFVFCPQGNPFESLPVSSLHMGWSYRREKVAMERL